MRHLIEQLEELTEGLKINRVDKEVIRAFTDKKAKDGKKLTTDGKRLDGQWMGGRGIAEWKGGKIHFNDLGSKAAQTVEKAVRKEAPKNYVAEARELEERRERIKKGALKKYVPLKGAELKAAQEREARRHGPSDYMIDTYGSYNTILDYYSETELEDLAKRAKKDVERDMEIIENVSYQEGVADFGWAQNFCADLADRWVEIQKHMDQIRALLDKKIS